LRESGFSRLSRQNIFPIGFLLSLYRQIAPAPMPTAPLPGRVHAGGKLLLEGAPEGVALRGEAGTPAVEDTASALLSRPSGTLAPAALRMMEVCGMKGGAEESMGEESGPVKFTCYRVTPGEGEGTPEEGMNTYSVVVLLPDGDVKHQVVWAGAPEDIGDAIRVPAGSRVIMTEMKSPMVWDSEAMEEEAVAEAAPTP